MKKLMIAAAVICSAAFVQAAAVYWSFGNINGYGTDGSGWGTDGLTGTVDVQLIIGTSLAGDVIGDTVYDATTSVAFDSGYAFPDSLDIGTMASDTPYYSQIIITSGDSTLKSGIYELQASSLYGDSVSPNWGFAGEEADLAGADAGSLSGLSTFDGTYGAFSSSGWTGSVPEPTSGLLMLLGMAGLALKRKRA
ncbi:MAG: PEP-CTERM sorting domain-containing protein [Kiritimatiellae bacterium]|nr:PEP-CTERM sorting domain-containing protein [Kiritimatiellia bacterium]